MGDWTRRLSQTTRERSPAFSSASDPDLEQTITAPAMQPASPDRSSAAQNGDSHRSPEHSPRGEIGTPKTTTETDHQPATNTNSCRSEAETPRIARLSDRIARGPRLDDRPETGKRQSRRRQLFPPGESMLQPGQCPPGQGIRPSRPGWVVGWWTGGTVLSTNKQTNKHPDLPPFEGWR